MSNDTPQTRSPGMTRCDGCGLETSDPTLLKKQRKSFSRKHVRLCTACQADSLKYGQRANWAIYGVGLLLVLILAYMRGDSSIIVYFLGLIAAIMAFSVLSVAIHELGHAIVAKMVGWHLCGLFLGFGRLLWQGRIGDVLLQFRFIQMGGLTMCGPKKDSRLVPLQAFLIFAAGPATNALAAWAGWTVYNPLQPQLIEGIHKIQLIEIWIFFNAFNAVLSLLPYKTSIAGGSLGSDGYQMIQALINPDDLRARFLYGRNIIRFITFRQFGELQNARQTMIEHLQTYPDDILGLQLLSAAESELGNYQACIEQTHRGLDRLEQGAELHPAITAGQDESTRKFLEAALQCNLAYAMLKGRIGDPTQALEMAKTTYEKFPWMIAIQHTYAYGLALNGQIDEAKKYLKFDKAKLRNEPLHAQQETHAIIAEVQQMQIATAPHL